MNEADTRITIVVVQATKPIHDWNLSRSAALQLAFLDSLDALKLVVRMAFEDATFDLGRVIVDRAGTADELLDLLALIPSEFTGDLLFIRDDRGGFLSTTGRGGDRLLYRLMPDDVRFYLETNDLVTGRAASGPRLGATA